MNEAKLIKILTDCPPGIQAGLNALAKTEAFTRVLQDEVTTRNLVLDDVSSCIGFLYDKTLKHGNGNDSIITLSDSDYTVNECAGLATFLRVQTQWPHGLEWEEEKRRKQTKH